MITRNLSYDEISVIFGKLSKMEKEFKEIMKTGTEKEKDEYLEKALHEVNKLYNAHANYDSWYMAFCDIRDGFTPNEDKTDYDPW